MEYNIREIKATEINLLEDFLYEAIFIPEGVTPPKKEIIYRPELQVYIKDFGKHKGDVGLVAQVKQKIVGAVWARIMHDYGHVDDDTPSIAISLLKGYRSQGIGTALLQAMVAALRQKGVKQVSLAVQKTYYAVKMYEKAGFAIVGENEQEYIMVCPL